MIKAFVVRRYRDVVQNNVVITQSKDVVGTKEGIIRAENVAVVLAKDANDAYEKISKEFQCQTERDILLENTSVSSVRLYQHIFVCGAYTYFLEGLIEEIII